MRKFINIIEATIVDNTEDERFEAFRKLADAQRGRPEIAMLKVQHAMVGGVLNPVVEHLGDITHRMSEFPDRIPYCGYEFVKPKVTRCLYFLKNPYGFVKEMQQNIKNNAQYREISVEEFEQQVNKTLLKYALEHSKLVVYNDAQKLARDAAVYLGMRYYNKVIKNLEILDDWLADPVTWESHASKYDPNYLQNSVFDENLITLTK